MLCIYIWYERGCDSNKALQFMRVCLTLISLIMNLREWFCCSAAHTLVYLAWVALKRAKQKLGPEFARLFTAETVFLFLSARVTLPQKFGHIAEFAVATWSQMLLHIFNLLSVYFDRKLYWNDKNLIKWTDKNRYIGKG